MLEVGRKESWGWGEGRQTDRQTERDVTQDRRIHWDEEN